MMGDASKFTHISLKNSGHVTYGDNNKGRILGVEKIGTNSSTSIENVLLVDGLKHSLLSVSQLCDKGYLVSVATYPSAGGRRVTRGCVFQERNARGVATNVYLRKTSEKMEKTWSTNFKWKVRELYLRTGKVLAPHISVTRDGIL